MTHPPNSPIYQSTDLPISQPPNPYVGPRTFSYEQRHLFFGREREARDLLARVLSERLLLFYAQSGAGKSSLINTRLIPALQEKDFVVLPVARVSGEPPAGVERVDNIFAFNLMLSIVEDCDPALLAGVTLIDFLARLARRTVVGGDGRERKIWLYDAEQAPATGGSQRYALIVDQFEEIITAHPGRWREREAFFHQLDAAMQADPNLWVVLTLREDYVAALDPYASLLADRLRARFLMQHMKAEAALEAVRRPAELAGRPFAPGVAEKLVDDLRQIRVPGQASTVAGEYVQPVQLEVVCFQLWEELKRRKESEGEGGEEVGQITLEDLAAAGDVNRALTQFYEETLAVALAEPAAEGVSERQLRTWFDQELITSAGTRGLVIQGATNAAGLPNDVVDILQRRFLVHAETRGGDAWIELVHDRFVEPIRASNAVWYPVHLSTLQRQAALWDEQRRADGLLLSGDALVEAESWAEAQPQALEPHEQDFLAACRKARERQMREQRQKRRIQILALGAVTGMVMALVLAWLALQSESEANNTAKLVRASQLAAQSQEVAQRKPQLAVLLAIASLNEAQAAGEENFPESVQSLRSSLANIGGIPLLAQPSEPTDWAISPDQKWFVAGGGDRAVLAWDLTKEQIQPRRLAGSTYLPPEPFSPDSRWMAIQHEDGAVLWDLQATEPISKTLGGFIDADGVSPFSLDSRWLVSTNEEEEAILWDLQPTEPFSRTLFTSNGGYYGSPLFSQDSRWMAIRHEDGAVLWDLQATEPISKTLGGFIDAYGVSPSSLDSRWLVSTNEDGEFLWDLQPTEPTEPFSRTLSNSNGGYYGSPLFSRDSRWLVSTNEDGEFLWDLQPTEPFSRTLSNSNGGYYGSPLFSRDSRWLVSTNEDREILWDLQPAEPFSRTLYNSDDGFYGSPLFSPDSRWLMVNPLAETDASVHTLWGLKAGDAVTTPLEPCDRQSSPVFSPSGSRLACLDAEGNVHVWDLEKPEQEPKKLTGDQIEQLRFSPDEKWLVATRTDHGLNVWHLDGEPTLRVMRGHDSDIADVRFLDDKLTMVTIGQDGDLRLWDLQSGRDMPVQLAGHDESVVAVAFDETNSWITSGGEECEVFSWYLQEQDTFPRNASLFGVGFCPDLGFSFSPHALSSQQRLVASTNGYWVFLNDLQEGAVFQCGIEPTSPDSQTLGPLFFSPNARWLAAATTEGKRVYVCSTQPVASELSGPQRPEKTLSLPSLDAAEIHHWAISSDARRLARTNKLGVVELWSIDSASPSLLSTRDVSSKPVVGLAFSSDGSMLAVAAEDKVELWPINETTDPIPFPSEERKVTSIAFNATGTLLAVGHDDGTIDVRNMHTMDAEPEPWLLPKTGIRSLAFSSIDNGRWLAAGGEDGSIHIIDRYQGNPTMLRDQACEAVGRNLSLSEWEQFIETDALEDEYESICPNWPPHPSAVDILREEGDQIAEQGDLPEAIAKYRQAMERDPDLTIEPETEARRIFWPNLIEQVGSLVEQGDVVSAVAKVEKYLPFYPNVTLAPDSLVNRIHALRLVQQARDLELEGKTDEAVARREQVLPLITARPVNTNNPVTGTVLSLLGDFYAFEGAAGQVLTINMQRSDSTLDTYLTVLGPAFFVQDDDSGLSTNSRIGPVTLPADGVYLVVASGYDVSEGAYRLKLNIQPATTQ